MMNDKLLTPEELIKLTGFRQKSRQIAHLKSLGVPFSVDGTGYREKALLSHMWNKAREWGYTDLPNPCAGIKGYRERGRDIYVENDLYYKVWDKADWPVRDAMDLAYLTGQRPADILKLNETDFEHDLLLISQNKTGKKLRIRVTGELQKVRGRVLARKLQTDSFSMALIVNESGQRMTYEALQNRFAKAREEAGIPKNNFQFRDLRGKAATDLEDLERAQKLLGHTTRGMTEHYTRDRLGDVVNPTK